MFLFMLFLIAAVFLALMLKAKDAGAQALYTPTSPVLCMPQGTAYPGRVWYCPTATINPDATAVPTNTPAPTATIQPYPGPEGHSLSFWQIFVALLRR